MIKKIFRYNIYWLSDQKNIRDVIVEKADSLGREIENFFMSGKQLRDIRSMNNIPNYIKGSLIDNSNSLEIKEALRSKFFSVDIIRIFLELSKYCVVDSIYRYKECDSYRLSRPLITLITTKDNGKKLRYLKNQELNFEYISINYENVKYAPSETSRKNKPSPLQYMTMSDNFNNYLSRSRNERDPDGDFFYYVPTELGRNRVSKIRNFRGGLGNTERQKLEKKRKIQEIKQLQKLIPGAVRSNNFEEKFRLETEIERLTNDVENLRQLVVKKEFRLESDHYYKKTLERFKKRVDQKLKTNLNLDDWCYCVIFSPQWCDVDHYPKTERGGIDMLYYLNEIFSGPKSFNLKEKSSSIDYSLLYFVKSCFEGPDLAKPGIYRKVDQLTNFDVVLRGFQEFPNGGYWIKKIVRDKKKYKEITEGPYSLEDANNRVSILKNISYLNDADVAKYYSFEELVCNDDLLEIEPSDEIGRYVSPEDRYSPPPGASLFCLIKGMKEVILISRKNLTTRLRKFSDYAINSGMRYISTIDFLIYYNPDSYSSKRKASELRSIIRMRDSINDDEFLWLVDDIIGKEKKRGKEPSVKPFAILSEYQAKGKMTYEGFKELYSLISETPCDEDRIGISFNNFKDAFGDKYLTTYKNKDFDIRKELRFSVLQDEEDDKPKKFRISRNYDGTYSVGMHRIRKNFKDILLTSVQDIGPGCTGYLNTKFKDIKDKSWEVSKLNLISRDDNFNNEIVLMCLNLFVAKAFGVKKVILDNRLRNSECSTDVMYHYYHIHFVGLGDFKAFEEIGFEIDNFKNYKKMIDKLKNKKILEFVSENQLDVRVDDVVKDETLEKFCEDFIETKQCFTKDNLILINQISAHIQNRIQITIVMDMDDVPFERLLRYITF